MLVAVAGAAMTDLGPWWRNLRKPRWEPPDAAFPIAWTAIYGLAAASAALAWRGSRTAAQKQQVVAGFALNGALNVLWSALFFRAKRPRAALRESVALWASTASLIALAAPRSPGAAAMLAPYLAWVSFAVALNRAIVVRNPGVE